MNRTPPINEQRSPGEGFLNTLNEIRPSGQTRGGQLPRLGIIGFAVDGFEGLVGVVEGVKGLGDGLEAVVDGPGDGRGDWWSQSFMASRSWVPPGSLRAVLGRRRPRAS